MVLVIYNNIRHTREFNDMLLKNNREEPKWWMHCDGDFFCMQSHSWMDLYDDETLMMGRVPICETIGHSGSVMGI